jgi:hypothetical protein
MIDLVIRHAGSLEQPGKTLTHPIFVKVTNPVDNW